MYIYYFDVDFFRKMKSRANIEQQIQQHFSRLEGRDLLHFYCLDSFMFFLAKFYAISFCNNLELNQNKYD